MRGRGGLFATIFPFFPETYAVNCNAMSKLYTTETAADFLGVTPGRVRQLITEGRLKSEKFGRDHLIREPELQTYAAAGKRKPGRQRKTKKPFRMR